MQGVGPGSSLTNKVSAARSALASSNTTAACNSLSGLINETQAQSGKKIPTATGDGLITATRRIMNVIPC